MAEFPQAAASRQALHDAAVRHLRSPRVVSALAGTSDKKSKAYRNAARRLQLATAPETAKQRRKPSAGLLNQVGKVTVKVKARYAVGGDPKYGRMRDLEANVPPDFFAQALADPDEAWQTFLEANNYPPGDIDNVQSISFK